MTIQPLSYYLDGITQGNRRILAKAITLVESTREEDSALGTEVVEACLKKAVPGIRIGITGVPGVGKSTFIEALGLQLIREGKRVAVLAVDPSSSLSRGSILGDKTRMQYLSRAPEAFRTFKRWVRGSFSCNSGSTGIFGQLTQNTI